ncbi:AraC family transcriptional regulator [Rhizobium sullae]|uniref:AraC-like DNA-binding protein n=1 Tax=Rhizobium sullae TaxID=50338 RepID=A0A4R3QA00_RHISU|nr:helix-turn-helix transcriptional regulator [Rhizobium sullae]TCU14826.1 AraC-like DNA-binding protein [Rhizobium sullae]
MGKQTKSGILVDPDQTFSPVFVLSDHHAAIDGPWHSHRRMQLVHVSSGVLTVLTKRARFVIPPQRAVWIEPGVEHRILSQKPFWLTTCYVEQHLFRIFDPSSVVIVDRLTDELLIAASDFGGNYPISGPEARLITVLLDRLSALDTTGGSLPEPSDIRLRRITDRLYENPAMADHLQTLSRQAAMTERTAARLFIKETGLTFGQWRKQLRLQISLKQIGEGASVTQAAFDVGYQDVSSFIAAFRTHFGVTPAKALKGKKA